MAGFGKIQATDWRLSVISVGHWKMLTDTSTHDTWVLAEVAGSGHKCNKTE